MSKTPYGNESPLYMIGVGVVVLFLIVTAVSLWMGN